MASKHIQRCSASLVFREVHIIKMAKSSKRLTAPRTDDGTKLRGLHALLTGVRDTAHFGRESHPPSSPGTAPLCSDRKRNSSHQEVEWEGRDCRDAQCCWWLTKCPQLSVFLNVVVRLLFL